MDDLGVEAATVVHVAHHHRERLQPGETQQKASEHDKRGSVKPRWEKEVITAKEDNTN